MDEAARCDRVALLQEGRVLEVNSPAALAEGYPLPLLAVRGENRLTLLRMLRTFPHAASVWPFGEELHYSDRRPGHAPTAIIAELSSWLAERGHRGVRITPAVATVEDVFMQLAAPAGQAA